MSSYRYEERAKSHANGPRLRDDVRLANNDNEPRSGGGSHGDGYRRGRGAFSSHSYDPEAEREVRLNRHNKSLTVHVSNNFYQDPNSASSSNRRGHGNNNNGASGTRSQGPLRSSLRSSTNGYSTDGRNQHRIRFDTSERKRNRSFREYSDNSVSHAEWKPDASGIPMDSRHNGQSRQNVGNRGGFNSSWSSGDWNRNSGPRRSGRRNEGARGDDGGFRVRRRGGSGGSFSFRGPEDENTNDRDNRSRTGGLRRRGSMRGSRGGRRGVGSYRGTANTPFSSKHEEDGNNYDENPNLDKPAGTENPEDSNSTDDDQYHLSVDMKAHSESAAENELEIPKADAESATVSEALDEQPSNEEQKDDDDDTSENSSQMKSNSDDDDDGGDDDDDDNDSDEESPDEAGGEEVEISHDSHLEEEEEATGDSNVAEQGLEPCHENVVESEPSNEAVTSDVHLAAENSATEIHKETIAGSLLESSETEPHKEMVQNDIYQSEKEESHPDTLEGAHKDADSDNSKEDVALKHEEEAKEVEEENSSTEEPKDATSEEANTTNEKKDAAVVAAKEFKQSKEETEQKVTPPDPLAQSTEPDGNTTNGDSGEGDVSVKSIAAEDNQNSSAQNGTGEVTLASPTTVAKPTPEMDKMPTTGEGNATAECSLKTGVGTTKKTEENPSK
ncbi:hypothetical protein Aperf_G00000008586 [Anoplocephala perfoliata]